MVFEMGSSVSAVFGVVCALIVFGYYPSAIVLVVLVLVTVFYLPTAVKRWLAGLEKNEKDHEALRNKLKDAGSDSDSVEIHVHAERIRIRAKNPILRFTVIWPLLVVVVPGTIGAAAMESWLFAVSIDDSALNKLLIVLMAMSLRTMLTAMTVVERVANRCIGAEQTRALASHVDNSVRVGRQFVVASDCFQVSSALKYRSTWFPVAKTGCCAARFHLPQ
jgi:hypothetical protein